MQSEKTCLPLKVCMGTGQFRGQDMALFHPRKTVYLDVLFISKQTKKKSLTYNVTFM